MVMKAYLVFFEVDPKVFSILTSKRDVKMGLTGGFYPAQFSLSRLRYCMASARCSGLILVYPAQFSLSRLRYCMASARCSGLILGESSKSAIVRETFSILS